MKTLEQDLWALAYGDHAEPHRVLGAHLQEREGRSGAVIRTCHPEATGVVVLIAGRDPLEMQRTEVEGIFERFVEGAEVPLRYRLRYYFANGATWEREDPYRFWPTLGDLDLHLFNSGNHRQLWQHFGAHPMVVDGVAGVAFAVWAPSARRVSVVGDFNNWDGRLYPMRSMGSSGVFELFIPEIGPSAYYKYEIKTQEGQLRLKADPMANYCELPPGNASRVYQTNHHWADQVWMRRRAEKNLRAEPMAIYEVHLESWRRMPEEGNRLLNYREAAHQLVEHMQRYGFNYLELLPITEYPFPGSWGYQVTGYYAPTARHGQPDDFRYLVDLCHQNGIGVIVDWVPAHFPKDDWALRRFDGTALYEHDDPRLGEHPDWGTLIFNYGRHEVRNFLLANAVYWCKEFHVDGLRVDAVASMLYLDYSRQDGQWYPNQYGGKENIEALQFLRDFNFWLREECPGAFTVAEESTSWSGVTRPVEQQGGLGFTFKWNMGWMHDTLQYFSKDPIYRRHHQNDLTFAMLYEHTEHFIMPLSHDEVVHGKGSLLAKMPGDEWQKFANLRTLYGYQFTRPGKKLLFMGSEFAPPWEWYYAASLDWHYLESDCRRGLLKYMADLGALYHAKPCLWRGDGDHFGFRWISCDDHDNSVLAYVRQWDWEHLMVAINLTPVPRQDYRIGAPSSGRYTVILNSDDPEYFGSGYNQTRQYTTEGIAAHGFEQSLKLVLPPLAVLILEMQP
ncbi:MAG: 1,4-alpha-glucan branching enzyme GlgB [Phycisphaerae bacterium]|nr:1,4-alpha-glucan branching enzyme GlgB [Phycisphaerae bacterium]